MADATQNGAEALVAALEAAGVEQAFGLPGVHNLPLWAALAQSSIRLVGVRHEQTAVYAADGAARVTGALGVAITTTGPGAANALGATGEAMESGSPVLIIATDIATTLRRPGVHRGVLHETRDQAAMFAPVVKATLR
ncbi:MAG: acetolactate synthase large subunit, partial [Nocardioidaceae bacterium]|nr:acetolactate synthase large subunit [Nocardioidaceae bacterium]